ncbi:MAG: hypothetical protein IPG04_17515 [Polyangiaceae bacterium]|nr:hypothetical protein [Polyangiaceae bacterium]
MERPAFANVFAAELPYVLRSLRRLGALPADVEDLGHDVFMVVHRELARFDPARPIRPWLFGIAFRVASDHRRLARVRREVPTAQVPDAAASPRARRRTWSGPTIERSCWLRAGCPRPRAARGHRHARSRWILCAAGRGGARHPPEHSVLAAAPGAGRPPQSRPAHPRTEPQTMIERLPQDLEEVLAPERALPPLDDAVRARIEAQLAASRSGP